ncbi:MAG: Rid family hydrolase, partial [Pseudomonadota bacterium]
ENALREVGAEMRHVMRVRAYLTDLSKAGGFIRAHGEVFKGIDPVLTGVEAGLTQPGMVVEIDVDAIVHDAEGNVTF